VAAQPWTAVRLHPSSAQYSYVYALGAGIQGGTARLASNSHPILWHGTNTSWTSLAAGGTIVGIWEGVQVGGMNGQAALWYGTPESVVSLSPGGLSISGAAAVRGDMQVGSAAFPPGYDLQAALWRGTGASFVDLHPAWAWQSVALATDGELQGGYAVGQLKHAVLWSGTAQSCVDLSPSGRESEVRGMAPGIQVGWTFFQGGYHASVWRGTAASWEDFNPPGGDTRFLATTGRIHVGDGGLGSPGAAHAVLNYGTPNVWLDLHQFLPAGYTSFSAANAVFQDGDTIYVGGYATSDATAQAEAFLWIGTIPCYANCDGSTSAPILNVSDFTCFLNRYAAGDPAANCDHSTRAPTLNVSDFICYLNRFAAGCS